MSGCNHETVYFGSGDYYVFCRTCPMSWVVRKPGTDEPDHGFGVAGYQHNQSSRPLSGENRVNPAQSNQDSHG